MFELIGDADVAAGMARYMKNRFTFVGVQSPARRAQSKPLLQALKKAETPRVFEAIEALWARPEREYQYVACDLALACVARWSLEELHQLVPYVTAKPWWDSVDALRAVFGRFVALHPDRLATVFGWFDRQPDFWLRRVAITLQLMQKAATDTNLLAAAILFDQATPEFFIQKAIGWALRQYSKTDPGWVITFMAQHRFSPLAVREGGKYPA